MLIVGAPAGLLGQNLALPSKAEVQAGTRALPADVGTALCARRWKEVANWDKRGQGGDFDYDLLSENPEYSSLLIDFRPDGSYIRYPCEPRGTVPTGPGETGRWEVVEKDWLVMVDDQGGDRNKNHLLRVDTQRLVFDLMDRYRTYFIALPKP
ncbi:MAG: hypothetical protein ACK5XP_00745 [Sphingobacteriia bacterium]